MEKQSREKQLHYINNGVKAFDLSTLPRCRAIAVSTGQTCKRAALKGTHLCGIHSGRYTPGAKMNNQNALTNGRYTAKVKNTFSMSRQILDSINQLSWALSSPKGQKHDA